VFLKLHFSLDLLHDPVMPHLHRDRKFCPPVLPIAFTQFLNPDHSVQHWLTSALPLVLAPWVNESLTVPVSPAVVPVLVEVTEAAPVLKKTRKPKNTEETAQDKSPRKRSPKTAAAQ
jgi:hypothetical protein